MLSKIICIFMTAFEEALQKSLILCGRAQIKMRSLSFDHSPFFLCYTLQKSIKVFIFKL